MHYIWVTATDQRTYKQRYRVLDDIEDRPLSVVELAQLHRISRNTVRRHIQELRREGVMIRYNPSDKRYYSAGHILREEERRKRQMIPNTIQPGPPKAEETDHPVEIRLEDVRPIVGATRWYSDRNSVWVTRTLKTTTFRREECVETRRDVFSSAMRHICYSLFYEQIVPGGRYLLGDVQTSASVPAMPVVCYHKPRELVYPLPLKEGLSWKDIHTEEQPYYSLRADKEAKVKTISEARGTYKVRAGGNTHYCLRILRATDDCLSEIYLNENGVEVLLRNYLSQDSPGWREEMKTQPVVKLADKSYHLRGIGIALTTPVMAPA